MLCGRILHIILCVALTAPNESKTVRISSPKWVYATALKRPSSNLLSRVFDKLVSVSRDSFNRARMELMVENVNRKLESKGVRLLILLEQSELFKRCNNTNYNQDGTEVRFSDNDKVLLPPSFFECCKGGDYNVPFQLLIHKVHIPEIVSASSYLNVTKPVNKSSLSFSLVRKESDSKGPEDSGLPTTKEDYILPKDISKECVSCSSIEFRTDENYIYVPKWIMENLKLKPFDVVLVELVKLDDCTGVQLKCLNKDFYEVGDIKRVLEDRLKYYSTLTLNSVIPLTIADKTYNFQVLGLDTLKTKNANFVSIQDVDLNVRLL